MPSLEYGLVGASGDYKLGANVKFAVVNGERQEPQPNLVGECAGCERPVVAKCGELRVWHWAHKGRRLCDPWWENETEWHRAWKNRFPIEWQEIVHRADDGERHIADVKTEQGYVIEFQHSPLKLEERQVREGFYKKMLWIVDGTRRPKDREKFIDALDCAARIDGRENLRASPGSFKNPLLRDWQSSKVPIIFDLGENVLWGLLPARADGKGYVFRVEHHVLIESLLSQQQSNSSFAKLMNSYIGVIGAHERYLEWKKSRADPMVFLNSRR